MGRMYAIMRALRFLVRCELQRDGPSKDGEKILELLEEEIAIDEAEAKLAEEGHPLFARPLETPPVIEGQEKKKDEEDAADG